jgi:hypothetical protein
MPVMIADNLLIFDVIKSAEMLKIKGVREGGHFITLPGNEKRK